MLHQRLWHIFFLYLKMNEKCVKKFILVYLMKTFQLYAAMNKNALCFDEKNKTHCCSNYAYNADKDRCIECVGRFGINCSEVCPDGYYGASCNSHCNCSRETCHEIWGCLRGTQSDTDGVCYDKENGTYCCTNYVYSSVDHTCQECVGRFGVNCRTECPDGYYGKQCEEKCPCDANHCDKVVGCLSHTSEIMELQTNKKGASEWVFLFAFPASISAVVLLVVIVLGIAAYRFAKKRITEISNPNNSTHDENEEVETTDIYADVTRSSGKPVRGILQHDMTYCNTLLVGASNQEYKRSRTFRRNDSFTYKDKQTVEELNSPYSMCLGPEDVYESVCFSDQFDVQRKSLEVQSSSTDNFDLTVYNDIDFEGESFVSSEK